jgi:hypothetical protein
MKQFLRAVALFSSILYMPAFLVASTPPTTPAKPAVAQAGKVGTFDKISIIIAYYHSPQWQAMLQQKQDQKDAAVKAHNTAKAKELEAWGVNRQELAMQQVLGAAPIDNILEALQPAFNAIEKKLNLTSVVEFPAMSAEAGTVDVTAQLMDWLKADDKTRRLAADMREQQEKLRQQLEKPCPTLPPSTTGK